MKKILAVIMVFIFLMSFCACGSKDEVEEEFDAKKVLTQLEVTEYEKYLIIKNNSDFNVKVSAFLKVFDAEGEMLKAETIEGTPVKTDTETVIDFNYAICGYGDPYDEDDVDHFEYELTVTEEATAYNDEFTYKFTPGKGKAFVTVTNNSKRDFFDAAVYAFYIKDGKIFYADHQNFENYLYSFDSGDTLTEEMGMPVTQPYDSHKVIICPRGD